MFRKPREAATQVAIEIPLKPSTGRPPTPPISTVHLKPQSSIDSMVPMASPTTPLLRKNKLLPRANGRTPTLAGKAKGKPNGSILNFFKKTDPTVSCNGYPRDEEESLFLEESLTEGEITMPVQTPTPPRESELPDSPSCRLGYSTNDEQTPRFNEDPRPVKRRCMESPPVQWFPSSDVKAEVGPKTGPFIEDSDSGDELRSMSTKSGEFINQPSTNGKLELELEGQDAEIKSEEWPPVPSLQRENTSTVERDEFEGIEDFIDDEFPEEGEEFLERQWMEEQRDIELGMEVDDVLGRNVGINKDPLDETEEGMQDSGAASCPICSGSFVGLTDQV